MHRESGEFLARAMFAFLGVNALYLAVGAFWLVWDSIKGNK